MFLSDALTPRRGIFIHRGRDKEVDPEVIAKVEEHQLAIGALVSLQCHVMLMVSNNVTCTVASSVSVSNAT